MAGATKTTTGYVTPGREYSATTIQNDNVTNSREQVSVDTGSRTFDSNNHRVTTPGNTAAQNSYEMSNDSIISDYADSRFTFNEHHTQTTVRQGTEFVSGDGYETFIASSSNAQGSNLVIHNTETNEVTHVNTHGDYFVI
jgi:hypothetical protein